jgi:hypothetical protein
MKNQETLRRFCRLDANIYAGYSGSNWDNTWNSGAISSIAPSADVLGDVKCDGVWSEQFIEAGGIGRPILTPDYPL